MSSSNSDKSSSPSSSSKPPRWPNTTEDDIPIYQLEGRRIVYDPLEREYWNAQTDIYLCEDDIKFFKLRPYDKITSPLPDPLPEDYFVKWEDDQ